jgi:[acyl-carrier-protein] S-malonyltransferase
MGMLSALAQDYPIVQQTFAEASAVLNQDLWALVQTGPEEVLNQTQNTQPAMLTAGVAVWRVWQANHGTTPKYLAGHSLGEYTALVCAGALEFKDAVLLVADRGRFMQDAVPQGQGGMAAILGLEEAIVQRICEQAAEGEVLAAVNFNAPGQVVVAGAARAVERAVSQAKAAGSKRAVMLPVSVPAHCALMLPAAERMAARLQQITFRPPRIPVIHNVHVHVEQDPRAICDALVKQIYSPVRWVETIQKMVVDGVNCLIECGPGKILTGLNKRIVSTVGTLAVFDKPSLQQALTAAGKN